MFVAKTLNQLNDNRIHEQIYFQIIKTLNEEHYNRRNAYNTGAILINIKNYKNVPQQFKGLKCTVHKKIKISNDDHYSSSKTCLHEASLLLFFEIQL